MSASQYLVIGEKQKKNRKFLTFFGALHINFDLIHMLLRVKVGQFRDSTRPLNLSWHFWPFGFSLGRLDGRDRGTPQLALPRLPLEDGTNFQQGRCEGSTSKFPSSFHLLIFDCRSAWWAVKPSFTGSTSC